MWRPVCMYVYVNAGVCACVRMHVEACVHVLM